MNNVYITKRKLINDEKNPFGRDCVFDDVTFESLIILKKIPINNYKTLLFLRKWF